MAVAILFRLVGILLVILAVAQTVPLFVAFALEETAGVPAFALGAGVCLFFGVILVMVGAGGSGKFGRRDSGNIWYYRPAGIRSGPGAQLLPRG